ncbi:MAG TPA: serine/threonine-protein kinase [Thermoanaerobaculia bacterium]|nr:serine/threonine-protein kinase [Thermoanaerobaculia bacterium]
MSPESVGPYRILEPLREGRLSSVYKARGPGDRLVAVKVFTSELLDTPAAAERFERELDAVAPLSHPNILQLLASGHDGGRFYVATELFAGDSLERLLKQRRLTVPEAIAVAKGMCRGLAYAHQRGFAHRHLTPRHVLVAADLRAVKLADFGPSEIDVSSELDSMLRTGAYALGSFHYLAPEQLEARDAHPRAAAGPAGSTSGDPRADLYSVGAILLEMLTGRPPAGKITLPSQSNAELPPATDVLVLKCLARNPEQRYASADELLADLEKLEEALRVRLLGHLRGISRLLGVPGSRRRTAVVAALLALLAAVVAAGYFAVR